MRPLGIDRRLLRPSSKDDVENAGADPGLIMHSLEILPLKVSKNAKVARTN